MVSEILGLSDINNLLFPSFYTTITSPSSASTSFTIIITSPSSPSSSSGTSRTVYCSPSSITSGVSVPVFSTSSETILRK